MSLVHEASMGDRLCEPAEDENHNIGAHAEPFDAAKGAARLRTVALHLAGYWCLLFCATGLVTVILFW